jgi:hypothetical protein
MIPPQLTVRITHAFDGPRHDRLHAIWDTVAEHWQKHLRLAVTTNPRGFSHAQMFNKMWYEELQQNNRYVLLTEHDFLPNLRDRAWYSAPHKVFEQLDAMHGEQFAALAPEYATRHAATKVVMHHNKPGGWWILIDKDRFNDAIDFTGKPDPANQLEDSIGGCYMAEGEDCYPAHYGLSYPFGTHLFWSRHYNDPPEARVGGFHIGDIQARHDDAVDRFLISSPATFACLFEKRHARLL